MELFSTIVYLINRLSSEVLNFESPYYHLYYKNPSYHNFHIFGCVYILHFSLSQRNKLFVESTEYSFMGYNTLWKILFSMIKILISFMCNDLILSLWKGQ